MSDQSGTEQDGWPYDHLGQSEIRGKMTPDECRSLRNELERLRGLEKQDDERLTLSEVERVIESVEAEVLAEDKLGASRNDVVEGTCQRIVRRIRSVYTDIKQTDD